jgi:DNA-binding protein HU-beta
MSITKTELASRLAESCDLSKAEAGRVLNGVLDEITNALSKGESITLPGFGTFKVTDRPERQGRNPKTGEPMTIKAGKSVRFTPGKSLKDAV